MSKIKTAKATIEALEQLLEIEREEHAAQVEEEEKKVDRLQEQVRELEVSLEEKEKIRVHLKVETVSRGREISAMREAVSKL